MNSNYMNGVTGTATMQLQQAPQIQAPAHSARIQALEDSLNTAHDRITNLEKLIHELYAKVG